MKTPSFKLIVLSLVVAGTLAGCAKESSGSGSGSGGSGGGGTTTTPTPTPTPDNNPLNSQSGATVAFSYVDIATLNEYVQTRPVNAPTNMKINVKLTDVGSGRYDGAVRLAYYDTGTYYVGTFNTTYTGSRYQPSSTSPVLEDQTYRNRYRGLYNSEFNQWFTDPETGKKVFHAFFQDKLGAVMLVITGGVDQGDGGGYSEVNGEVWFKNFSVAPAAQSDTQCWFHFSPSPYRCGAFYSCGNDGGSCGIQTNLALRPGNGYKLLGTFSSLNKVNAFGK